MADNVEYPTDDHITNTEPEETERLEVPADEDAESSGQVPG